MVTLAVRQEHLKGLRWNWIFLFYPTFTPQMNDE